MSQIEGEICSKCEQTIKKETDGIYCDGLCGEVMHADCVFLKAAEIKVIKENENVNFICDVCQRYNLKTINNKFNGLYDYLYKLDKRTQEILNTLKEKKDDTKKSGNAESNGTERSFKPTEIVTVENNKNKYKQKQSDKNEKSTSKQTKADTNNTNINAPSTSKIQVPKCNETRTPQPKKNDKQKESNVKEKKSKENKETTKVSTEKYVVIVRPKTAQSSSETIKELNRKCNPNELNLNNVTKTKFGSVIIGCTSVEQQNVIKSRIESSISNEYDVSIKSPLSPKIKIFGITEMMQANVMEDLLKRQNPIFTQGDIKVLKIMQSENDKQLYNAIVQLDKLSFERVMKNQKVLINWDSCIIKEHYSIVRCHNCSGFNHLKSECKHNKACGRCAKGHDTSDCDEETLACINCMSANDKYSLNLNTNHHVWSKKCEILKRKINRVSKRTEYAKDI